MSLFNINKNESVQHNEQPGIVGSLIQMNASNDVLMWKYPANDIMRGAVIKVHQNQRALLYSSGQRIDNIGPGREIVVDSANIPGLKRLLNKATGGETSYPFEVWFANMSCEHNINIGITANDGILFPVLNKATGREMDFPITAFGSYRFKLYNPEVYCDKLVGTTELSSTGNVNDFFADQIKVLMIEVVQDLIKQNTFTITQLMGASRNLNENIRNNANKELKQVYGIELTSFNLRFNSPAYQKYTQEGLEGAGLENRMANMGQYYDKENQYDIMKKAAANSGAGNFMGIGMGFGMGTQMGQMVGQMAQNITGTNIAANQFGQITPPPVPSSTKRFFFVINGQSAGPLDIPAIQAKIAEQTITSQTLAWTEGMTAWAAASSIAELSSLFATVPPPIPNSL
ncbi:SPFH domain-containing protein [Bacteroides finegoldii]|uniref:SPFH domain-containing protein n=1 Tax=Bacteroides finegoldii TaxID=338188 RepID=UPI0001842BE2|nr:SPFH domain-containing protein [Bacteroides finegoldii]EEX46655.1 hypothetical protein BACFIN_05691 [Bacteroides finegoldii DSM 17565]